MKHIAFILIISSVFAIEGHDPTPRFIHPDFSLEEERVTWPIDLIEFFKMPFIEYLRYDTTHAKIAPVLSVNSSKDASARALIVQDGFVGVFLGRQSYFGDGTIRQMIRTIEGYGGYAGLINKRFPYAVKTEGKFSTYRGEYEPSTYYFTAGADGFIPIGNSLMSLEFSGTRESWAQNPGNFPRNEPDDRQRAEISNAVEGALAFRSMPGEFTGFELFAGGVTSTRYEANRWEIVRTVMFGSSCLIYDSRRMRFAIGASVHRNWRETVVTPKMDFEIIWKSFTAFAELEGYIVPIERYETVLTPRTTLPANAEFMKVPIAVKAGAMLEVIDGHFIRANSEYIRSENKPVIWNPYAEVPKVSLEAATHQNFDIELSSEFGILRNEFSIKLQRDIARERHIPTEAEEVFSDTLSVQLRDFSLFAGGYRRMGQPFIDKMQETNLGLGATYSYKSAKITASVGNILTEPIYDDMAMEFSDDIKFTFTVSLDF